MNQHPARELLQRLIDGQLDTREQSDVEGHVETCVDCQTVLDALTPYSAIMPVAGDQVSKAGSSAVHIRCPHCHNPIELVDKHDREVVCPSCGSSVKLDSGNTRTFPRTDAPRWLGKYELLEHLGAGAFGRVYKARDTQLDRMVAVKIPRAGNLTSQEDVDRFLREARSAAQLRHPGIVSVHDAGQNDGTYFIVSEFVQGTTLSDWIGADRLTFRQAAELVADVADALDYAHRNGVVHRDVKPANIMLEIVGVSGGERTVSRNSTLNAEPRTLTPRLMDFGLAKRDAGEITMTLDGQVLGTPAYMPPEQARGEGHSVDARGDVYSLGVILYELLTGELPFRGNSRMLIMQVLQDEPRPPRRINDKIPRDLETICLKAMAKSAAGRYLTACDLADDLRRWLAGEPIHARPIGVAERFGRWCRRNPLVAGLTAAVALTLIAGSVVSTWSAVRAMSEKERADENARTANTKADEAIANLKKADENAEEARHNLYAAHMNLAQSAWEDTRVRATRDLLQRYAPGSPNEDLRGFEWHYWDRLCQFPLLDLKGHTDKVLSVAFSPDGKRLASASEDKSVKVWDATSGNEVRTLKGHSLEVTSVAFSPDGKQVASASQDQTVKVWDAASGVEVTTLKGQIGMLNSVSFSPDGKRLAAAGFQVVKVWEIERGQVTLTLTGHMGAVAGVAFSPDGERLASASVDGTVKLWDATGGRECLTLKGHTHWVLKVAFSPDGKRLASASIDGTVKVWDTTTGEEVLSLKGHKNEVLSVAFSPDGKRIASASHDQILKVWDATSGAVLFMLKGHTGGVLSVAFSPDGRRLASAGVDWTVKMWDAMSNQETPTLTGHNQEVQSVAFSPDGKRLASASKDKVMKIWDVTSGQEAQTLKGHTGEIWSVAFSPDGNRLASGSADRTVRIWDTTSGEMTQILTGHTQAVERVAFSPDGKRLASASSDRTVKVWDVTSGEEVLSLKGHNGEVFSVAFDSDGERLASASKDKTVKVWDATSGKEILTLKGHANWVRSVAFSPDGNRIASASEDRTVKVWDAGNGKEILTMEGHADLVWSVAFSPDGKRLASGSQDKTVRVWDATGGQETMTLNGHIGPLYSVAFSPDGNQLAAAGSGTVKVWDARPWTPDCRAESECRGWLALLCQQVNSKEELIQAIQTDQSIGRDVRDRALEWSVVFWNARITREAEPLNNLSWEVVREPNRSEESYDGALRQAQAACRIEPDNGSYLNTLGIAQYRVGNYDESLTTLTRSDELNSKQPTGTEPADIAFLAMAHHRLGHNDQARQLLERLVQLLEQDHWKNDSDGRAFLREAEAVIEGNGVKPEM